MALRSLTLHDPIQDHGAEQNGKVRLVDLRQGDCLAILQTVPDESLDAVVSDPPYVINIKKQDDWDTPENAMAIWQTVFPECYRALKNGSFLVAFGHPKTYHRMVTIIEDAGFTIHNMVGRAFFTGIVNDFKSGLKPAFEPIVIASKGSVKLNALEYKTE